MQQLFFIFFSLFSSRRYFRNGLTKDFLLMFHHLLPRNHLTRVGPHPFSFSVMVKLIVTFCVFEHAIPCALEINCNDGINLYIISLLLHVNGQQTWQDEYLPWGASTYKVTWLLWNVVLQDHVTNKKYYISNTAMFIAAKLCRVVIYNEGLSLIKSHDTLMV